MLAPRSIVCGPGGDRPLKIRAGALALLLLCGCASPTDRDGDGARVVATLAGRPITQAEIEARIRGRLVELDVQRYEAMREGLEEFIDEILLEREARARQLAVEELLNTEVAAKAQSPTADDVERFFDDNKAQLGGRLLEDLRPGIEGYLRAQQTTARRGEFLASLRESANVTILLPPPTVEVSQDGPSKGPAKAPVTIVEFSDFGCQFCRRAAATLTRILEAYPDQVRLVYRHYPIQPDSERVARAASCADEHGKFWEYHDLLFANQHAHGDSALRFYARTVGLDEGTFTECLTSGRTAAVVEQDAADGNAAGVSGTPAFFINGRPLSGALPYTTLKEAIEEALEATRSL